MKSVVFGGGGFIGSAIVEKLLGAGHQVRIFERPRVEPFRSFGPTEKIEWTTGDLSSSHDINAALDGMDVVFHLVSTTLPKSSNDDPIYDVQSNLIATLQMLKSMTDMKMKKIVFISSGGTVYGPPQYIPIDENHPTDPISSYGITKLAIEKYLNLYQVLHGIKHVTLRVANPFGERQRIDTAQGAVAAFIHRAITKTPIEIWGDGSITRDYIYIDDVAEAFLKAADYCGEQSVFNISSGLGVSLNELASLVESVAGSPLERIYRPGRSFDVPTSILSNTRAISELGWSPKTSMPEGLRRTFSWAKSHYEK